MGVTGPLVLWFKYFFVTFNFSVAMAANQIEVFWTKMMFGRGLNKEHFCKTSVKISVMREQ